MFNSLPYIMSRSELPSHFDLLRGIADGSVGALEKDRGGHWSAEHGIWVDCRFKEVMEVVPPEERQLIEILGEVGLGMAKVFRHQLADARDNLMWPGEVFKPNGASYLLRAVEHNPSIEDPYSLLSAGLEAPAVPYS